MQRKCDYSELIIPNDPDYISIACAYVDQIADKTGFDLESRTNIEKATREALANVIEHAFGPHEDASFSVACERVSVGLRISVKDRGQPFDPAQICTFDPEGVPHEVQGEGVRTMMESVDEVLFNNLGKEGKETVLIKYLTDPNAKDFHEACELTRPDPDHSMQPPAPGQVKFVVRAMQPADAVEVSRCAYEAYGYTYDSEHVYYPERLIELNRSGHVYSAMAVADTGEIAGHCALIKYDLDATVGEAGMGFVRPAFRGHGCFLMLTNHLIHKASQEGLTGFYAEAVTSHTYSQQVAVRCRMNTTAILLGYLSTSTRIMRIAEHLGQRESLVTLYLGLNPAIGHLIYPPPHHEEMILKLYEGIGSTPEIGASPRDADKSHATESSLKIRSIPAIGFARIVMERYSINVFEEVRSRLNDFSRRRFEVLQLYLNLGDPMTPQLTEQLESLGFFFSGILPGGCRGDDALILQYLNRVPIDYDLIKLESEMSRELLAYIKNVDPGIG